MKVILLLGLVAAIAAAPIDDHEATIVKEDVDSPQEGNFKYNVETSNGIKIAESGSTKVVDDTVEAVREGSYSYTAPDGTVISLKFVADETGFHAVGDHLPVPLQLLNML